MSCFRGLVATLALLLTFTAELYSQASSGGITGTVSDGSGAAVPGAAVLATNRATGERRESMTNQSGTYVLTPLPIGDYDVQISREGFKKTTRTGVRVDANVNVTVDARLEVGSVTENLTVQASGAVIETESSTIGNSRYEVQLKNLPVIVREIQTLVGQTAGVPAGSTDTIGGTFNQGGRSAMQVMSDGAQMNALQTTAWPAIDGIDRRADLAIPSIDAIEEVKFVSGGGKAEYGQPTQVIVASKSGGNALHGSAFEFYRSGGLGARRWEAPERQSFVRHQFGGTLSGPIRRDKTFFLASTDNFRHTANLITRVRYPTAAEKGGNLASYLQRTDAQGRPALAVTVLDPLNANRPFANNVIPVNRFNPVSVELLKSLPDAPLPANVSDFNAVYVKPAFDNSEKYDVRVDHNFNDRSKIFARATIAHLDQASRYAGDVPSSIGSSMKNQWNQTVSTQYTRLIDAASLFTVQFTYRNMPFKNIPSGGNELFPVPIVDVKPEAPFGGPPAIAVGSNAVGIGTSALFDRLLFNFSADYNYTIDPTYSRTIGNHTVKAGFTWFQGWKTTELASPPYGRFTTASDFNNARSTTSASGDAFADFLLGYPSSTDVTIGERGGFHRKKNWQFFVQDDWKATPRLTLNFGLRYDNFGFFEEHRNGSAVGDFATGKILINNGYTSKIHPAFRQFSDRFVEAGQVGLDNTFIRPNNFDFAPRIGAAYRIASDFVLRGGFGVYNVDYTINEFRNSINVAPFIRRAQLTRSLLISQNIDVNTRYTFTNPTADSSAAGADTQLTTLEGFNPDYPTMKTYAWNFTIEKGLGRNYSTRATYSGNVARNLSRVVRVNACPPGPTECLARANGSTGARKWSTFGTNLGMRHGDGESNYNALELEITRRFSGGLFMNANYGWSKILRYDATASDPVVNPLWSYDYGPFPGQPAHVFHYNFVWSVPYGKGQKFGGSAPGVVDAVLGGWSLSGLTTWQSGQYLTVTSPNGQTPTGANTNRANRVADGRLDHSGTRGEFADRWFDTTAYQQPGFIDPAANRPTRQFGSAGSGTVIGPSFFSFDSTLSKTIAVREKYRVQLRVEMFNPFNVPMLANPEMSVVSPNFGRIRTSNTAYTPRNFQFGARLDF